MADASTPSSAAIFAQLREGFREKWIETEGKLFNLEIHTPGHFSSGIPGIPDTFNRETHEWIASVAVPFTGACEGSLEGFAAIAKSDGNNQIWLPTKAEIDKFKGLCAEAGAALPSAIRDRLEIYHPWIDRSPESWWVSLLVCYCQFTVYSAEGIHHKIQPIVNPWLDSINVIDHLGLNTESPSWSVIEATAVSGGKQRERDRKTEARDKWIYEQVCDGIGYATIRLRLKKKPKGWGRISSDNGVKAAAKRYAGRHKLTLPAPRKSGRPKK